MLEHISERDTAILRALACEQAEIAARPEQKAKASLWTRHNALKTNEPVVFIDPENGWNEIVTDDMLECTGEQARSWETLLRKNIFWGTQLKDDKVIDDYWNVPQVHTDTGWGLNISIVGNERGKAYHINGVLREYEDDFDKLRFPQDVFDEEASRMLWEEADRVFGGILRLKSFDSYWWTLGMTSSYINLVL